MTIILDGTTGITTPTTSTTGEFVTSVTGFKNRIINGAMVIDQRNAGASATPTATNTYVLDRWQTVLSASSKYSVQQNAGAVTPPSDYINYLGCTSLSAYTVGTSEVFAIRQSIEGLNVADLAWGTASAATVTLSFWVRSSLTGTFGGALRNSAQNRSYPFSYTISAANTWEQKTLTVAGDTTGTWLTTNGVGIQVVFSIGTGATLSGTAGAWASANYLSATGATSVVGTNGATFYITGVQLEKGSTATSFDVRDYGRELALCQRYYWPLRGTAATPSFLARNNAGGAGQGPALSLKFPQSMRTAPTATQVGSWTQTNTSGGAGPTTPSCFTTDYVTFYVDSAGSGDCIFYLNGTANGFNFSAEL